MSRGVDLIAAERARQKLAVEAGGEGYTAEHDAGHFDDLAEAAAAYALATRYRLAGVSIPGEWPWHPSYWKPTPGDRVLELQKAGALIAAAIDSLLDEADRP